MNTLRAWILIASLVGLVRTGEAVEVARTQASGPATATSQLDASERTQAREWGLSIEEFRRAQGLLRGFTGSVADTRITPIEILGIHAKDESERERYAEKFVRLMIDYAERALKFEEAYQRVAKRLYPSLPVQAVDHRQAARPSLQQVLQRAPGFEPRQWAGAAKTAPQSIVSESDISSMSPLDRLILFTGPECKACPSVLQRAQAYARRGTPVDLYVVGVTSDAQLIQYARKVELDARLIEQGMLTLNRDQGTMRTMIPGSSDLPQTLRRRGDVVTLFDANQL